MTSPLYPWVWLSLILLCLYFCSLSVDVVWCFFSVFSLCTQYIHLAQGIETTRPALLIIKRYEGLICEIDRMFEFEGTLVSGSKLAVDVDDLLHMLIKMVYYV